MDKNREYEIILEALYELRTATKRELAVAYFDCEKERYNELAGRIWDINDAIASVREKLNKLLSNGG